MSDGTNDRKTVRATTFTARRPTTGRSVRIAAPQTFQRNETGQLFQTVASTTGKHILCENVPHIRLESGNSISGNAPDSVLVAMCVASKWHCARILNEIGERCPVSANVRWLTMNSCMKLAVKIFTANVFSECATDRGARRPISERVQSVVSDTGRAAKMPSEPHLGCVCPSQLFHRLDWLCCW